MRNQSGQSLIELLIAMAVLVMAVSAITFIILDVYLSDRAGRERTKAVFLAKEGMEVARSIRDNNWASLINGSHGLTLSDNKWIFQGTEEDLSTFLKEGKRKIIIEEIDSNRKRVTSQVTWKLTELRSQNVSLITYLTNWLKLVGNWVNPFQEAGINLSGAQDGLKIQTQGDYAYLVRNDGTPDFVIINISNPATPSILGSLNLSGAPVNIAVSGDYAYIASQDNNQELQVINISNPSSPNVVGIFDTSGTADANGIYVSDSMAYLVRNSSVWDEFLIINVSLPSNPTLVGSLNLNERANEVIVLGNYAYVASGHNSQELQVVDITNPSSPSLIGSYNLSGNSNSLSITGFNNTVVLGRADGLIYLFNVTNPNLPNLSGYFDTTGAINDISLGVNNTYAFLATSAGASEFRVVNISTPTSPTSIGELNLPAAIYGISYSETKDRAFVANSANNEEFIVISPR